jgi:4-amino-4-deoxy-L-arabinose transferase-like glycosyltransferase
MLDRFTTPPSNFFTPGDEGLQFRAYAFLILLCLAFFTPGLATLPPIDRDEPAFAQATKQMIQSDNYVDIRLQGAPRYKKPIGIYWLQATSVKLLNARHLNEIWAYRIPSFVGATIAVLMTAAVGSLLFGPMTGLLAAIMMSGCLVLNIEARLAKTDATLLASIMIMQYGLAKAYMQSKHALKITWPTSFIFWTAIGAGILIKGPIILLVLTSTLLWLRLTEKNLTWFSSLRPVIGIPYVLLLIAPWFVAIIAASHGQFLQQSAGHDMIAKLWQGQDRGVLPPGLNLILFPVIFFPFALFAILAAPDAWHNRNQPATRFCLGWIIPTWIVFEMSLTKLPHYVMPTYPAIAMLAAKSLLDFYPTLAKDRWRWLPPLAIGLWLMISTGLATGAAILPVVMDQVFSLWQIGASLVLVISQGACLFLLFQGKPANALILMALGTLILTTVTLGSTLPNIQSLWLSREVMKVAEAVKPCPDVKIVASAYDEPSLIFLAGTDTNIALRGEYASAFMLHDPCRIAVIDNDRMRPFLASFVESQVQPYPVARLRAFNLGQGKWRELNFYLLPKNNIPSPKYP